MLRANLSLSFLPRFAVVLILLIAAGCSDQGLMGPFFVTTPTATAVVDGDYEYDSHAAGYVHDITYSIVTGPVGMAIDSGGMVTWTPATTDLGEVPVTIMVTDGEVPIMQEWVLVVHQDVLFGVAFSPIGHAGSITDDNELEFLTNSDPWGRLISFNSPWRNSVADAGNVPDLAAFAQTARIENGIEPAVGFSWAAADGTPDLTSEGDGIDNSWTNQETRDEFLAMVTYYASVNQPPNLFLGYEVNTWYLGDMAGWPDWLSMLGECYDSIKAVSPNTIVSTIFQLEHMKGLGSGTVGWMDAAHWNLVDDIAASGKIDAIGFTSYPYFEYATPMAIPAGYYDEISAHWTGPVIFHEIAWPATAAAPYPGAEMDQSDFVTEFLSRTNLLDMEYISWKFLHDFDGDAGTPGFLNTGFRSNDGMTTRLSDATWQAALLLRERP
ncbi:MAG: hypothetical protein ACI8X5_002127 [Planctomycetota bacterium]|jgi:hypothetical protein